jgi:hypothetical protein
MYFSTSTILSFLAVASTAAVAYQPIYARNPYPDAYPGEYQDSPYARDSGALLARDVYADIYSRDAYADAYADAWEDYMLR